MVLGIGSRWHVGVLIGLFWPIHTSIVVYGFTAKLLSFRSLSTAVRPSASWTKQRSMKLPPTDLLAIKPNHGFIPTSFDNNNNDDENKLLFKTTTDRIDNNSNSGILKLAVLPWLLSMMPLSADAAVAGGGFVVQSALVAYAHYASFLVAMAALVVERCTVDANLTVEQEDTLANVDAVYGIAGLGVLVSGYYRLIEYGKGWDFYSHEPIFWVKLALVGILGGASLFPTIQFVSRLIERRTGKQEQPQAPISPALAARLKQVINAEITALLSIPLAATFMSRGVLYTNDIPWQASAGLAAVISLGVIYKYSKEALTWKEPESTSVVSTEE